MPSVSLLSIDDDTLSYLLSTLEAPDLARSCCTSRALKQLVDREWADENKEKYGPPTTNEGAGVPRSGSTPCTTGASSWPMVPRSVLADA